MMLYCFKMFIVLLTSYVFYITLLKKETYFKINRAYLLSTLIISIILPFIQFNSWKAPKNHIVQLPTITVGQNPISPIVNLQTTPIDIPSLLLIIGILVGTGMLIKLTHGLIQLKGIVSESKQSQFKDYILVESNNIKSPMSFLNYLFWNPSIPIESEDGQKIFQHEYTHIKQKHSYDILFIEILKLVFWWNPVIYLYKKELRDVHEYLADKAVVLQVNKQQYGQLLIEQTMSFIENKDMVLANYFFHSQLKKRIVMMTKKESNQWAMSRYMLFLPIIFILSGVVGEINELQAQTTNNPNTKTEAIIARELIDTIEMIDPATMKSTIEVYKYPLYSQVEKMPVFAGCDENLVGKELYDCSQQELLHYIYSNIKYPEEAREKGIEGTVIAKFIVYPGGQIYYTNIVQSVGFGCDEEVNRLIMNMPNWQPGEHDGSRVNVEFHLPVKFKL